MDEVVLQFQSMGKLLNSQFSFLTCNWFQRENTHINTYYLVCSTDVCWQSHSLYETPIEARQSHAYKWTAGQKQIYFHKIFMYWQSVFTF